LNQLLTSVGKGATLFLQRSHFPPDICRALQKHQITAMAAVPPLWIQLMQGYSPFPTMPFPSLRYITNSGGVFPVELVRRYRAQLPHTRIVLMYGLSEAFRSAYLPPDQIDLRPGSMGRAIPETDLYVLDEEGRECAPGQVGELVHRGPTVALGYWEDPEATRGVFRPNPLTPGNSDERVVYSGDLVKKDEEGYLYFVSRRDQMIKSQGFRVSPEEVEEGIFASGMVSEAAVCGEPDPVSGAIIIAHVVPKDRDAFNTRELLSYCQREMPSYMVPRMVHLHDALPRTTSGKLDRKALKK
jgi:acyl-CoA synthetase (AMP-forming)/AMP-acid ligase II